MKRKGLLYTSVAAMAVAGAGYAFADLSYTQGSGTTIFDFSCFSTKHCPVHVNITSTGAELFTSGQPGNVSVTNVTTLGQALMAGSSPVVLPSDQQMADPCTYRKKTNITINTTATGNTALVSGVANQNVYICSMSVLTSSATSINILQGINASCTATSTALAAIMGSTTALSGMALADNGGLTYGSGVGTVAATVNSSSYLCISQSGTGKLAGNLSIIQSSI